MQDLNDDDNFDTLLQQHFARTLNGQLGKAEAAVAQYQQHQRALKRRWAGMGLAIAGLAMAAAVAGILLMKPAVAPVSPTPAPTEVAQAPVPGEYQMDWQTIDQGTVYLDDQTPMRSYLNQRIESIRWIDPQTNATVEMQVPHEEIVLVALNSQ